MRLLEKYRSIEKAAEQCRSRYSREAELYCLKRERRVAGRWPKKSRELRYYLFWLNMHYFLGLMGTSRRSDNSILS